MKFQFYTTAWKFVEDSKWGSWIYVTNAKRQINIGLMVIVSALLVAGTIYGIIMVSGMGGATLGIIIISLLFCIPGVVLCLGYVIPRQLNWKEWKKQFLQVAAMSPEEEDGELTITFTEQGCVLNLRGETIERFRWNRLEALREWSDGWDFIDKHGFSGISVRRSDMIEGNAEDFTSFIQQMSKKECKPRAIELSELQRRFS